MNLAAQFHAENTAFPNAFPRKGNKHPKLHRKTPPRIEFLKLELSARIVLVLVGSCAYGFIIFTRHFSLLLLIHSLRRCIVKSSNAKTSSRSATAAACGDERLRLNKRVTIGAGGAERNGAQTPVFEVELRERVSMSLSLREVKN